MTKLINLAAVAAVLSFVALPAGAAELLNGPTVQRGYFAGSAYPFIGWRPSFEFTSGFRYYHSEPYFIGPSRACGVINEPVTIKGETYFRQVYRCW